MQSSTLSIRKPVFLLLSGALLLLAAFVFFLYRDGQAVRQQNRDLIIQNDSILSVNIVLTDSVKQKGPSTASENASLTIVDKEK